MTSLVVAGGGPAGALAATLLARAGHAPLLLERTTGPTEKICGEFVSGEAVRILAHAGFDIAKLGGHTIGAVRLIRGTRIAEARLPFTALGVSRGRLDEALLDHAGTAGATVRRGCTIARAEPDRLYLADGTSVAASTLFLATGKHDVRGLRRDAAAEDLVGFKMHFALSPRALAALAGHVEVIVFADAYVGLQRIEAGRANLCLLARRRLLEASGGDWHRLLARMMRENAHLAARLDEAVPLFDRPLSIFRVPYGFVHTPMRGETVFRLGDQAAVIPSFAGDGMAIALHSATLAAKMFRAGADAEAFHHQFRRDVAPQVSRAWGLYRLGAMPMGQAALIRAASLFPPTLRLAASLTRVPRRALARAA